MSLPPLTRARRRRFLGGMVLDPAYYFWFITVIPLVEPGIMATRAKEAVWPALSPTGKASALLALCEMQFELNGAFAKFVRDLKLCEPETLLEACDGRDGHHHTYRLFKDSTGYRLCRESILDGTWATVPYYWTPPCLHGQWRGGWEG
jgi:hypothetical protein